MLVSGIAAGLVFGLLLGGDLRRFQELEIKAWPALAIGASARIIAPFLGGLASGASILGLVLIAGVAVANFTLPGALLVAGGSLLNALVSVTNGGMPVDPQLVAAAGKPIPSDGLHVLLSPETRFPFLADVLLVPVINNIYSLGDVVLAIGGFWMTFRIVKR